MKALEKQVEKLTVDLDKNTQATKRNSKAAGSATGNIQRLGIAFRTTLGPIVAVYGAINFLNKSLQVASQRQVNVAKLSNGLKNLGGTQADLEKLVDTADQLGKSTLFDQEDFTQNFALLTSFQRIGVDSYERVSKAAADLATITGQDLKSAQIQLAKALEDPAKRVTDLARSGTVFTDQQKEQIKVLQESGRLFEAQNLILAEIEKQYGGAAEAAGRAGLAGALDTLGEVTRDFQEALTAGTGAINLAQQAILALAGAIEQCTQAVKDINTLLTALDGIIRDLNINADGLTGVFDTIKNSIIDGIPGLRQTLFYYEQLLRLAGQYNDSKAGTRNFGSNYASQEKELFEKAGGWNPYKSKTPTPTPTPVATGTKGADAAANAAAREAERVAETLLKREQLVARLEKQLEIQNAVTDIGRASAELELEILEINQKYDNLLKDETNELIRQNTERARALELDMARADAAQSMVSNSSFSEMSQWYADQSAMTQELGSEYEGLANSIATSMTGAFKSIIDGSKSAEEAFADMLGSMADALINYAMEAIAQYIAIGIARMFAGMGGGGGGGYSIPDAAIPKTSGMKFFADGGRPPVGEVSVVGEKGPELFVPDSAGTILSNQDSKAAMAQFSPGNNSGGSSAGMDSVEQMNGDGAPTQTTFKLETQVINGVEYATVDQVNKMGVAASQQGAKDGEMRALRKLRMSPSARRKVGL